MVRIELDACGKVPPCERRKILLFANTDWYLFNFRLPLAMALRDAGWDVVLLSPHGSYGPKLVENGLRWIPLKMTRRSLNPLRELGLLFRIADIYRRERPTIVHHFTIKCVVYGSLIAKAVGIKRRVNAVTGMGYVFMNRDLLARMLRLPVLWLMRIALSGRNSRLILQNSEDLANFVKSGLAREKTIRLIRGSGVNVDKFRPAARPDFGLRPPRVLFAARILYDKGIEEFVQAAELLHANNVQAEFVVAGEVDLGNPAAVPEKVLRAWKMRPYLNFLGHVSDMVGLLHSSDIAVLPSYREGAPRSLIEAAACGLPIVTTDVVGCREVVEPGITGLLVPVGDHIELAAALRELILFPEKRAAMGEAGRRLAVTAFGEAFVVRQTMDVYSELVPQ